MNRISDKLLLRLTALLLTAVLFVCAAGCSSEPAPDASVRDSQVTDCADELSMLASRLDAFYASSPVSDVSASDTAVSVPDITELRQFTAYGELRGFTDNAELALLRDASMRLLDEETAFCKSVWDESSAASLDSGAASVAAEIASASDIVQLYGIISDMSNRLLGASSVACSAENRDAMHAFPSFRTDGSGNTWLVLYTNYPLPGFEDGTFGYSLRLALDGGKTELTVADSIYAHDCIAYDNGYCVCFNLSSILKNSSADVFFNGRNRVTFTLFALDNSFSSTEEFYRLRRSADETYSMKERQAGLAATAADAAQRFRG